MTLNEACRQTKCCCYIYDDKTFNLNNAKRCIVSEHYYRGDSPLSFYIEEQIVTFANCIHYKHLIAMNKLQRV